MNNRELAATDTEFRKACAQAGVYPSRVQYRKWKHGRGAAFLITNGEKVTTMPRLLDNGIRITSK